MSDDNLDYEKPKYTSTKNITRSFGSPRPAPKPSATKKKRGRPSKEEKDEG